MSGARALERVLIVGPLAAEWTRAAQGALRAAGFIVARLSDNEMIGMPLAAGGVRAVLVDARLVVPSLLHRIARLQGSRGDVSGDRDRRSARHLRPRRS